MIYINFLIKIKTYRSNFYLHKSCIPFETNHLDFELQKSQKKKTVFSQYFMMRHKRLACFVKRAQHILDANAHKNLDAEVFPPT